MKEVERWIKKAKEDLEVAKFNFKNNFFEVAAFFSQQAVEKALKALYLKKFKRVKKIHDLVILGKDVDLPDKFSNLCKELTSAYLYTRYPEIPQVKNIKKDYRMDKKTIIKLKEFKKEVEKEIPLDALIFFGSRVRGKYHKDSDVDLIVVSKKFRGVNFFKRVARMYNYWKLNLPVDFLCYAPEEFDKLKKEISIVSEALREGVEI